MDPSGPEKIRRPATPLEALEALRQGNRRFVADQRSPEALFGPDRLAELAAGQQPFAIVLGCSDSRVPVELVFDQGFGDLFVIRVAGNIAGATQVGSIEFAALEFGTRLVVVLGHSQCGAIGAALEELRQPGEVQSPHLGSIIDLVRPSLEGWGAEAREDWEEIARKAVRANVRNSVGQLRHKSEVLRSLIEDEGLLVVGGEYALETGRVEFFGGLKKPNLPRRNR